MQAWRVHRHGEPAEVLSGGLSLSAIIAIQHFVTSSFDGYREGFSQLMRRTRDWHVDLVDGFDGTIELDAGSEGHFVMAYVPGLAAKLGSRIDFLAEILQETGCILVLFSRQPGARLGSVQRCTEQTLSIPALEERPPPAAQRETGNGSGRKRVLRFNALILRSSIRRANGHSLRAASIETNAHDRNQTRILDVELCDRGIRHGGAKGRVRSHWHAND